MRVTYNAYIETHTHGRHCDIKLTSLCEIASKRIQRLLKVFFKTKKVIGEQEKESIIRVRVG